MTDKSTALLKAQALGDADAADELNTGLSEDEREHYYLLTLALFAGAIGHRLGEKPSHDTIVAFVNEVRHDFRNADPKVNPLVVEALIRAVFGEDHLLDGISAQDQYLAQLPVIRKIVAQSPEMTNRIDEYLKDAETLQAAWSAE